MSQPGVPFSVTINETGFTATQSVYYVTTERTVMGMLRLEAERLVVQLAESRKLVELTDSGYHQRTESDDVTERAVPLAQLRDARLRRRWLVRELVLTATDLRAFAGLPGAAGVELRVRIARRHRAEAEELVGAVRLQVAELALQRAEAMRE
jgi:hypothetical protein